MDEQIIIRSIIIHPIVVISRRERDMRLVVDQYPHLVVVVDMPSPYVVVHLIVSADDLHTGSIIEL